MNPANTWLLPVDHRNLRAFYARGLAVPSALMAKYRPDLLESTPGRLPLVREPVDRGIITKSASAPDGIATLLEFPAAALSTDRTRFAPDPLGVCATATPLPITRLLAVHVAREEDAAEIRARAYSNVNPSAMPLRVSPDLFTAPSADSAASALEWMASLDAAEPIDEMELRERECVAGAVFMLLDGIPGHVELVRQTTSILNEVLGRIRGEASIRLQESLAEQRWIEGDDRQILDALARVLIDQSGPALPSNDQVIKGLRSELQSASMSDPASVDRYLEAISEILLGERPMAPFQSQGGLRVLKALLLFLLRPEPKATRGWFNEPVNAEDEVCALALLLAGLSHRAAGVPTDQRGRPTLESEVMEWVAAPWRGSGGSGTQEISLVDGPTTALVAGGETLREWEAPARSRRHLLLEQLEADPSLRARVAEVLGWDDCVETLIQADSADISASPTTVVVRIAGRPRIQVLVVEDEFARRLQASSDEELASAITRVAGEPTQEGTRSPARSPRPAAKPRPGPEALPGL